MGQRIAKRHASHGVMLYNAQQFSESVVELENAYEKLQKKCEKFAVLGYLCLSNLELGRYRDVLQCSKRQIVLSGDLQDERFHSEAMFNLARAHERLGEFRTSIDLCDQSIQNEKEISSLSGYVHLCLGNNYFALGEISNCLQHYDKASHVARILCDSILELRVYIGLGQVYTALRDNHSGLQYHVRASEIARQYDANHPCVKYQRRVAVEMAVVYWKLGRLGQALEICEEAIKQALTHGDRMVQAKCLLNFAEIHRERMDFQRAFPRYESAYSITKETGDRKLQIEVLAGMAKCAAAAGDLEQAVELNETVLKLSQEIGCKLDTLECRKRLCEIYISVDATDLAQLHGFHVQQLLHELQLYCGVCTEIIGDCDEKIRSLQCFHIIHERCVVHLYRSSTSTPYQRRPCPMCRHRSSSNPAALVDE